MRNGHYDENALLLTIVHESFLFVVFIVDYVNGRCWRFLPVSLCIWQ